MLLLNKMQYVLDRPTAFFSRQCRIFIIIVIYNYCMKLQGRQIKWGGGRGGEGGRPPSWQHGPKVVPFSDFTCAHFQETMSLVLIIKTTYCFIF